MSRSLRIAAVAIVGLPLLLTGCAANAPGDLTAAAARVLRPAVEDIRHAAATGTSADLRQAVQRLKDLVQQEERAGEVSAQRATAIEDAADVLLQDARPSPSPTPSSESPTPTPTSESPTPSPTPSSPSPSSSPTPSNSQTPIVSFSAGPAGNGFHGHGKPTPSSSPSNQP